MTAEPISRPSARVLVIGPGGTLLLFHIRSHEGTGELYWLTPGGGIQPGESPAAAAARELREETGIAMSAAAMGPVVAWTSGRWSADGHVFDSHNSFFSVRVAGTRVDTGAQEDLERSLIVGHRWWTADELAATAEHVVPPGLSELLRSLLADGPPPDPVHLSWR
jgi:8-oxo-dGTP pyrophosphatase MutT (NUDIX family)